MIDLSPDQDVVRRYVFNKAPDIRVMTVRLEQVCQNIFNHQNMPGAVSRLCAEMTSAIAILTHMLKFDGEMIIQLKGNGPVSMVVAECSTSGNLRATAQWVKVDEEMTFKELVGVGYLAVTMEPNSGDRYQGIVTLDEEKLSDCLNVYFKNSEQLDTKIWLGADLKMSGGLLIQRIAKDSKINSAEKEWITAEALASTVKNDELIGDAGPLLVYRLFDQLEPRGLPPWPIRFRCSCSRQRSANAFQTLGKEEATTLFQKQAEVSMTCHFCGRVYQYDKADLRWLFSDQPPESDTVQ